MQHDNHIIRQQYANHIAKYERIMENGNFGSPDAYYAWKDRERKLAEKLNGKHDAMYFWHGGMSN